MNIFFIAKVAVHAGKVAVHAGKVAVHAGKVAVHVGNAYRRLECIIQQNLYFLPKSRSTVIDIIHITDRNTYSISFNIYALNGSRS